MTLQTMQNKRFTYGDQFDPKKFSIIEILEICQAQQPDRYALQTSIRKSFFEGHGKSEQQRDENSEKMAMNCLLSLKSYRLINVSKDGKSYQISDLAQQILSQKHSQITANKILASHILTNLEGLVLARLIERIRVRGEQVTLEYLGEEMNELGIKIPPNSTYISTMREWLAQANVFRPTGYELNWDVIYDLLEIDQDFIDSLYDLTSEQKYFLMSLISLDVKDFTPSNQVAKHTRDVYKIRLTTKNLVKDILEPLENLSLIETQKTTAGRGAKPHLVKITPKTEKEVLEPLLKKLSEITNIASSNLNKPFDEVVRNLDSTDKHVRGIALELLSIWIVRLLGLRFTKWRARHWESTGGGEVDVLAASDRIIYNRWQIQCKNQASKVGVDVIAKEVGLTFLTKADIIMVITTSQFAADAINYANQINDVSRYYVILLEGDDIKRVVEDKTKIVDILNIKARRTFAKRELGESTFDNTELLDEEQPEDQDILEDLLTQQVLR